MNLLRKAVSIETNSCLVLTIYYKFNIEETNLYYLINNTYTQKLDGAADLIGGVLRE